MNRQPDPPSSPPKVQDSQFSVSPPVQSPISTNLEVQQKPTSPKNTPKDKIANALDEGLGILHVIGEGLLGPLWMMLFESIQDAVVLGLLVKVPAFLSWWVTGKSFSGLDACLLDTTWWSTDRYACFAIVISDYTLWALLIPRILYRFWRELRNITSQGGAHDSQH